MPLYEYICRKCQNKFGEVLTIKEHETKKPQCPKCQSADLEKVIEPFFAKTARKTRGYWGIRKRVSPSHGTNRFGGTPSKRKDLQTIMMLPVQLWKLWRIWGCGGKGPGASEQTRQVFRPHHKCRMLVEARHRRHQRGDQSHPHRAWSAGQETNAMASSKLRMATRSTFSRTACPTWTFRHFNIGDDVTFSEEAADNGPHAITIRLAAKHYPIEAPGRVSRKGDCRGHSSIDD
jgi:putative FmdB family regulatory protein